MAAFSWSFFINTVEQFLNFAVFMTLRIIRAGSHGASLPNETSEPKGADSLSEICQRSVTTIITSESTKPGTTQPEPRRVATQERVALACSGSEAT